MANPTVPDFTELGARKLADLLEKGFVITGYCFERQVEGTQPQRGFVDFAGFVGWWRPEMQPRSPLTAKQMQDKLKSAGYDEPSDTFWLERTHFISGFRHAESTHGITAHGVADMKGGQDVDA